MNMKKLNVTLAILLAAVMAGNALTVTSDVVGYQKATVINSGYTALGLSMVKAPILTANVASKVGSKLTLSQSLGTVNAAKPYYLEVVSGSLAGERVDVTVISSSAEVTIVPSSRNTSDLSTLANGVTVTIRPHILLRDLDGMISPALVGNDDTNLCDRVLVFNNGFIVYNKSSDNDYYQDGELDPAADALVIPPGAGVLIHRRSASPTTVTEVGTVRSNKFSRPYANGYQFIAPAYPLGISPNYLKADNSFGWNASDRVLPFNNGFISYVFDPSDLSGGANGTWYQDGELDPANAMTIIQANAAAFIYKHAADAGIVENSPVAN